MWPDVVKMMSWAREATSWDTESSIARVKRRRKRERDVLEAARREAIWVR